MTKQLRACKTVERETLFDANKFQSWKSCGWSPGWANHSWLGLGQDYRCCHRAGGDRGWSIHLFSTDEVRCRGHRAGNRAVPEMHLFLALNAKPAADPVIDDLEDQELIILSRDEIESKLHAGEFKILAWAAVVFMAWSYLRSWMDVWEHNQSSVRLSTLWLWRKRQKHLPNSLVSAVKWWFGNLPRALSSLKLTKS